MMSRQAAWQWLAVLLSCVLVVSVGGVYTNASVRRSLRESQETQRRSAEQARVIVCSVLVAQDDATNDPDNPPMTERARRASKAWHDLRVLYGC